MEQSKQKRGMLLHLISAFGYSWEGLSAAWSGETAFRIEIVCAAAALPVALLLPVTGVGKALLIGSVMLVLVAELLNSAIESVVDRVSLEHHALAKRAKDMGSAAVFISLINAVLIWLTVLLS